MLPRCYFIKNSQAKFSSFIFLNLIFIFLSCIILGMSTSTPISGQVYYGMHFQPGVAEYKDKSIMIYINGETAKNMDQTFPGKPVFVDHRDNITEVDFSRADGYVSESFFNQSDGNHWVKFIVTTKDGEDAIQDGYRLSNSYYATKNADGGTWHGVDYDQEVLMGVYDHLALVDKPRYEESIIMTPDEFKAYNRKKDNELKRLSNNKGNQRRAARKQYASFLVNSSKASFKVKTKTKSTNKLFSIRGK